MARIDLDNIKKIGKLRNALHDTVHTTYTTFEVAGERFVQFDTYGKADRETPGKVSQSFQVDKATAEYLVSLLRKEFNLK